MEPPSRIKFPKLGGLKHLERLLRLRQDSVLSTDAVFVSLDLEVASDRRRVHLSSEKPVVRQLGFARLDTRDIHSLSPSSDLRRLISLSMFKVKALRKSKREDRECVFAQTQHITQNQVLTVIGRNLHIKDGSDGRQHGQLRKIVLVGHSVREDLRFLHLLGIDVSSLAHVLAIIDTHTISRFVFPPYHPTLFPEPGQDFSLAGVLAELGCRPHPSELHNAGNDAVFTLYAMLLLAIKRSAARAGELTEDESTSLEVIRRVVSNAVGRGLSCGPFN